MFHILEKYRTSAQVLLGVIGASFMLFGMANFQTSPDTNYIVRIGKQSITRADLDRAMQNAQKASNGQADRQAVFQSLMQQAYLLEGAKKLGLVVSDEQIKQIIVDTPDFHNADGKFDANLFKRYLEDTHQSEQGYMEEQRRRLTTLLLLQTLNSGVASDFQANMLFNATLASRTIRTSIINPKTFVDKVQVTDAALRQFYTNHKKSFVLPQAVQFEYVILSAKELAAKQTVSDEELKRAFNEQKSSLKPKRQLAHIMLTVPSSADAATVAKIKAQAEKIAAQAQAQPEKFAQLAQKYSQDAGSAQNGGELGVFAQDGSLGSKSLEEAAFTLTKGAVSGVVQSHSGFHVLRVLDILDVDFEGQKEALRAAMQEKKAQQDLVKLRDEFSNLAFDTPDKLQPAADKIGVPLQKHTEWLTRTNADSLKIPKAVVDALFSDEVFHKKYNSGAISANGVTWFVRATATRPETVQTFEQAKAQVQTDFIHAESVRLATAQANEWLKQLQSGQTISTLEWTPEEEVNPEQMRAMLPETAFTILMKALPKNGKMAYALLSTPEAPMLVEVRSINNHVDTQTLKTTKQYVAQINDDALIRAFIESLQTQIPTKQGAEKISDEE